MKKHLNPSQRSYAEHWITFVTDLLSLELAESLRRTSLACAENRRKQAGIIDLMCGLYLQDPEEISRHFKGDFVSVVTRNFPKHRLGQEGLIPKTMLDELASESDEGGSFGFSLSYSDDVLRLVWLSEKLANAVGKKASIRDVIAAVALDREWMDELSSAGLTPSRTLADFDREIGTIVFHATPHSGKEWPKEWNFELDNEFQPPYELEMSTPSGPFQPVRSARVKLNGRPVADLSWPEKRLAVADVELKAYNTIEIELDGPKFGSVELTVRGTPIHR